MKKTILLLPILLLISCASQRILQSSQKEIPDWISIPVGDSFIISTEAETDMDARIKLVSEIKNKIVHTFYLRLGGKTNINFNSRISKEIENRSGVSSFFKDVDLTHAQRVFWQQVKRKDGLHYIYYCQYPFPKNVEDSLVGLWRTEAAYWQEKIDTAKAILNTIQSKENEAYGTISEILNDIEIINQNKSILSSSDSVSADLKETQLHNLLQGIGLETEELGTGQLRYRLLLDGHPISPDMKPSFNGCAKIKSLFNDTTSKWQTIKYAFSECNPCDNSLSINLVYEYFTWKYESSIPLNLNRYCVDFQIKGFIRNSYAKKKSGLFSSIEEQNLNLIILPIQPGAFKITRIDYSYYQRGMFNVKGITRKFDNLNTMCKGNSPIEISLTKQSDAAEEKESIGTYKGLITIHYLDLYSNRLLSKAFDNQEIRIEK
jgi:hypothetical protein